MLDGDLLTVGTGGALGEGALERRLHRRLEHRAVLDDGELGRAAGFGEIEQHRVGVLYGGRRGAERRQGRGRRGGRELQAASVSATMAAATTRGAGAAAVLDRAAVARCVSNGSSRGPAVRRPGSVGRHTGESTDADLDSGCSSSGPPLRRRSASAAPEIAGTLRSGEHLDKTRRRRHDRSPLRRAWPKGLGPHRDQRRHRRGAGGPRPGPGRGRGSSSTTSSQALERGLWVVMAEVATAPRNRAKLVAGETLVTRRWSTPWSDGCTSSRPLRRCRPSSSCRARAGRVRRSTSPAPSSGAPSARPSRSGMGRDRKSCRT